MKTCYIVGAGDFYGEIHPTEEDLVIAADGGYDTLISHGVRCDILIGDLDSIKDTPNAPEILRFPIAKDDTDTFLAFKEGFARGYRVFYIHGGTGGRPDHTYANYQLLLYAKNRGANATLIDNGTSAFAIKCETVTLRGECGHGFSVFAISPEAKGVTIKGAKYEVENVSLWNDFPLGISNEFKECEVTLTVKHGAVLVMI